MNQEQMISLVRQILFATGGGLVTHGYVTSESWATIAAGIATLLVTSGWALYTRRANGLIDSAAAQPTVQTIVTDPAGNSTSADIVSASSVKVVPR